VRPVGHDRRIARLQTSGGRREGIRCKNLLDAPRRPFEVRWHAADRARSKSIITLALADSYRAELVRAARKGLEFDPRTGEPVLWAEPQ
jgi:hypothetical protein